MMEAHKIGLGYASLKVDWMKELIGPKYQQNLEKLHRMAKMRYLIGEMKLFLESSKVLFLENLNFVSTTCLYGDFIPIANLFL